MSFTTIKATHDGCGDVDLTPSDIHLKIFIPSDCRDFYEFICTTCSELVQKSADANVIRLLRGGGVSETLITLPIEILDPMRSLLEPITHDTLLDFCLELHALEFWPVMPDAG